MNSNRFIQRTTTVLAALAVVGVALTGCSATPAPTPTTGSTSVGGDAFLASVTQAATSFPVPTTPISGVAKFAGGTVFYIPITLRAPSFVSTQAALTEALGSVGIKVQSCPADGNPANIAACSDQAIAAGALAIVSDALPYQMGVEAFGKARAAGIPVVVTNQGPGETDFPADKTLAYLASGASNMDRAMLHWAAQDSGGKATILVSRATDGFWSSKFMTDALAELPKYCAGCTVVGPVDVSTATQAQLQANLSAQLISDPNITYVISDFAQYIPQVTGAITDSGRTDVKYLTGGGSLGAIQGVAGGAFTAVAADATAFIGWHQADTVLRLITGLAVPEFKPSDAPVRLFTKDTLPQNLNDAAEASGEWFGPVSFKDDYKALWK